MALRSGARGSIAGPTRWRPGLKEVRLSTVVDQCQHSTAFLWRQKLVVGAEELAKSAFVPAPELQTQLNGCTSFAAAVAISALSRVVRL